MSRSLGEQPQTLRAMNRRLVLESVLSKRACTRPELSSSLNLSKTTIKQICDDLIGEGILREGEEIPSQRQGRPAAAILPDTDYASLLAIDIGADKLIVRLADFSGATLHEIQKKYRRRPPTGQRANSCCARSTARSTNCWRNPIPFRHRSAPSWPAHPASSTRAPIPSTSLRR